MTHNNQNTKCTEQIKDAKSFNEKSQVKYKMWAISITPDFSVETLKPRRAWGDIVHTLSHRCEVRLIYTAKLSHEIEEKENHSRI